MLVTETDITITNVPNTANGVPKKVSYACIYNPSQTVSIAFTVNGQSPAINGTGITIAPNGSYTFDGPEGAEFPLGDAKFIASAPTTPATILWVPAP